MPHTTNTALDVFNVSSCVATDTIFRCIDQATAYAGAHYNTFADNQYFYEFNRSYQTSGWNPNSPICDAPKTSAYPYGDPNEEYFKCHSGELYFVFGTVLLNDLTYRDLNDVSFSQFVLDSCANFAWSYNPNPYKALLQARNCTNTLAELEAAGEWEPASKGSYTLRELQWPSKQMAFWDVEQCAMLRWPLDYYT